MAAPDPWADFIAAAPQPAGHDDPWSDFAPAHPAEEPGVLADVAKSAAIGIPKGAIGIAGLPGDLGALRDAGIDKLHRFLGATFGMTPDQVEESVAKYHKAIETPTPFSKFPKAPTSGEIQGAVEKATGPFYEAKTQPGRIAQTVGEFVPAALTGGEGIAANVLKGAVAPGVGSELAGDKLKGTWLETPARIAGAIFGGGLAHGTQAAGSALKTIGAQREVAKDVGSLVGEPAVNSGAVSRMAKDVANDQLTPERAAAQVQALGPESMMLDMGRQLGGRAEAIATQPGKGQNTVLNAVEGRTGVVKFDPAEGRYTSGGEGTASRMKNAMDSEMGPAHDVVQLQDHLEKWIDQRATPAYNKVMGDHPVVDVPSNITNRPAVAAAMKNAPEVAKNYGEKLESPSETKTILRGPGYHIADDVAEPAKTSLRYWDYVKKSMDQRIRSYYQNGGTSELGSADKADLGGLQAARSALVSHLDEVTGGAYKQAREISATKPQLKEALQDGRDALNTKLLPEEMADHYQNLSAPQREMYKVGVRREVDRIVDVARNDAQAARNVLDTNQNRKKIATMFGEGAVRRLEDQIAAETIFQGATNRVAGNSRTAVRQQLVKDTESPSISQPPQANLTGFAVKGVNKLRDLYAAGLLDNTRTGLGAMAATPGEKVPDLVRLLAGYNQRATANARPPLAPYAGTLARVLGLNAIQQGAAGVQDQRRP